MHAGACTSTERETGQRTCVHAERNKAIWFCCGMRDKHKRQEKRSEAVLVLQLLVCILTTGRLWCRILLHEVVRRVRRFKRSDKVNSISENSFRLIISSNVGARICLTSCQVLSFLYILLAHINLFENSYSVFQYILCRTKSTTKVASYNGQEARTGLNVVANSRTCTDCRCRARIVGPH